MLGASFADSPLAGGAPTGRASTRLGVWSAIDPTRTSSAWHTGQGCESWLADGHELGYPTLDYQLTTLFPPVRPKGWLELRYLDALPTRGGRRPGHRRRRGPPPKRRSRGLGGGGRRLIRTKFRPDRVVAELAAAGLETIGWWTDDDEDLRAVAVVLR